MAQILEMEQQRRHLRAKRGFQGWTRRFDGPFSERTTVADLADATLKVLIRGGEDGSMPLYDLILGVKGLGPGPRFYDLASPQKMAVMDIALFLLDQFRFEAMRRLGWIEDFSTRHMPLIDLIEEFPSPLALTPHGTPDLAAHHPRFADYLHAFEGDRAAFVRKLIPEAIEAFEMRE